MDSASEPPKKKSLFTAKALARKSKVIDEEDDFNFSRAKALAAERFAEDERRRQKRALKLEMKQSAQIAERKRSSKSAEDVDENETPPKKRKVFVDAHNDHGYASDSSAAAEPKSIGDEKEIAKSHRQKSSTPQARSSIPKPARSPPPTTLSARYAKGLQQHERSTKSPSASTIVTLSDTDDVNRNIVSKQDFAKKLIQIDSDDDIVCVSKPAIVEEVVDDDPLDDEDEEFPELVHQARERERLRLEQVANSNRSFSEKNHSQDKYDSFSFDEPQEADPSIEILITSEIDGAAPLRVKRKMSQKLREARFAWCDRQRLPQYPQQALRSAIFLTWKRKKVYDYTTCQALGLKVDDMLRVGNTEGMLEGKVHLEAWTEDTFATVQKAEEAARLREERGGHEDEQDEAQEEVVKVKLVMSAKDMEPVKLVVRKTTRISKLISVFAEARDISEDKDVSLYFDGDELNPDDLVEDTELDDMDNVEVHIK